MKTTHIITLIFTALLFTQCNTENGYQEFEGATTEQIKEENGSPILNPHNTEVDLNKPFYQGTIMEVKNAGGYSYLLIKEDLSNHEHEEGHAHKNFWVVVERTPAEVGDDVRFQKELVTKNYESKILGETFDEVMFASNLQHRIKE